MGIVLVVEATYDPGVPARTATCFVLPMVRPRDFTPPRTHMFVRVEIDGVPWLADVGVGVGGLSTTAALRLDLEEEQSTPHEPGASVARTVGCFSR